ncbi:ROK family protein [Poritiphilus flavus]|uniref:ROK family protein n=1 Tax=Poritiphilus flavus TaxID=2697053 RepID=A0A6L9ECB7_9FLAO|nr:ROK family protein [Poritiphilus flavus]NAS12292.1 ROK family protein [Poritiphilus flavus]
MQNPNSIDNRIVMTLDAGGTNFIFSAIKENEPIIDPIRFEPHANKLEKCLKTIIKGFEVVKEKLIEAPAAISFAFPGPADYPNGIIGNLPNFPAFSGGVALGPMLEHHFKIPVFINNDGNLFAYGESKKGFLRELNQDLERAKSLKKFKNLIGITLGTGFGVGIINNGQLIIGDNSNGGEGWPMRDILNTNSYVEEHISREGIRRSYANKSGLDLKEVGSPVDIYLIAKGAQEGNKQAALETFEDFGTVLGEAIANLIAIVDGIVVFGGGISKAFDLFSPSMFKQLRSSYILPNGNAIDRLPQQIFNLQDPNERNSFLKGVKKEIEVPGADKKLTYEPYFKIGIGVSKYDTAQMIAIGAYNLALNRL